MSQPNQNDKRGLQLPPQADAPPTRTPPASPKPPRRIKNRGLTQRVLRFLKNHPDVPYHVQDLDRALDTRLEHLGSGGSPAGGALGYALNELHVPGLVRLRQGVFVYRPELDNDPGFWKEFPLGDEDTEPVPSTAGVLPATTPSASEPEAETEAEMKVTTGPGGIRWVEEDDDYTIPDEEEILEALGLLLPAHRAISTRHRPHIDQWVKATQALIEEITS